MANKQLGWRVQAEIIEKFIATCKAECRDPRTVIEKLMKDYTQKEKPSK